MFLTCGEALYDVFVEEETATGLRLDARIGGSPFNVAVGLARLGQRSALFTGVSLDPLGGRLTRALSDEGVETGFLVGKTNLTTLALVGLHPDGGAHYSFYGADSADGAVTQEDIPELPAEVSCLHFGSYSLVVEPTANAFLALAERSAASRLISLDPNVRLAVEPDIDAWRRKIEQFSRFANIVKASDDDLAQLYPGRNIGEMAKAWLRAGVSVVVVTRGSRGATLWSGDYEANQDSIPKRVVDTVGAGDSFQAALLCALTELGLASPEGLGGLNPDLARRLLTFAAEAAALTCTRCGADLPRRPELPRV